MAKKAPDPTAYWDGLYDLLPTKSDGRLYKELNSAQFRSWDGASIAENQSLGKRLSEALGNPYNYANSSFVSGLRDAMFRRRRYERVEQFIKTLKESSGEYDPCTERRNLVHDLKLVKSERGLTGIVERHFCKHCNSFQYKVLPLDKGVPSAS
jgi:hypothetical protein